MALTDKHLHEIGVAVANVEAAIRADADAFRALGADHAHTVGDMVVFSLAMRGFLVSYEPEQAARVAAEFEFVRGVKLS